MPLIKTWFLVPPLSSLLPCLGDEWLPTPLLQDSRLQDCSTSGREEDQPECSPTGHQSGAALDLLSQRLVIE